MADSIGVGLALNVLLWLGGLVIVCCLGVFAILGFIPKKGGGKRNAGTNG